MESVIKSTPFIKMYFCHHASNFYLPLLFLLVHNKCVPKFQFPPNPSLLHFEILFPFLSSAHSRTKLTPEIEHIVLHCLTPGLSIKIFSTPMNCDRLSFLKSCQFTNLTTHLGAGLSTMAGAHQPHGIPEGEAYAGHTSGPSNISSSSAPTSRTYVQKVLSIISQFTEYKKFLVHEIGFEGILKLPQITRLNLKFSKWVLQHIDVQNRCIVFGPDRKIKFYPPDVHKVFGIPCSSLSINDTSSHCSSTTIQFIRASLGMAEKGNQILKAVEVIPSTPLAEKTSSSLEKDCFKMSFVIFVMGHLPTPSAKHDRSNIDFLGAIANTDNIKDFNWCEYILQDMLVAATAVNTAISSNKPVTQLQGCHLSA